MFKMISKKCFYFIGRSGAGKASLPSPARSPPAALWRRLSHKAVPAWAAISSHPHRPSDPSDSGPGSWDDTWPGGSEKQNNSAHYSSVSFIPRSCTPIPLHLFASCCREVLHLIAAWKYAAYLSFILLGSVKMLKEYSLIFMWYLSLLSVVIDSMLKTLCIDIQTMYTLIFGGQ